MAVFSNSDLKKWRERKGMSAADLAELVSVDTSTIYKYESGKIKLNPDVMFQCCEALGDIDVWNVWMRTEYPSSYGRMHPETEHYPLSGAVASMYGHIADVVDLENETLKDCADGQMDSEELKRSLSKEITEMLKSAQRVKSLCER